MGRIVAMSPSPAGQRETPHVTPPPPQRSRSSTVIGVDGCPDGWITITWNRMSGDTQARHLTTLDELDPAAVAAAVVAIDMPLRVPDDRRDSERALRRALGPRRSSVFATPPRVAIDAPDHATASVLARAETGRGVSRQAWNLVPKIREAIVWAETVDVPVIEVHPEGAFTELLGAPARGGKKSWAGMTERLAALTSAGFALLDLDPQTTGGALTDDLLDAAAAAWSADRYRRGVARPFPDRPHPAPDTIWA